MEIITKEFELRTAEKLDLTEYEWITDPTTHEKKRKAKIRLGLIYFLKSYMTNVINGPYKIKDTTNIAEIKKFFKDGRLFVFKSPIEKLITPK